MIWIIPLGFGLACSGTGEQAHEAPLLSASSPETLSILITDTLPHDITAFTQGLEVHGDILWESTGKFGESSLRMIDRLSGDIIRSYDLPEYYFGEGITVLDNLVYQLTWQSGTVLSWDTADPSPVPVGKIDTQGWGICSIDDTLVTSNGTSLLRFRDPVDLSTHRTVIVTIENFPQIYLNELEWAGGYIYANQWGTDRILRIDPATGIVTGLIDCSGLLTESERRSADVLNGIAWDPRRQAFLITGKYWPRIYVVKFRGE